MIGTGSYQITLEISDASDSALDSDYRCSPLSVTSIDFKDPTTSGDKIMKVQEPLEPLKASSLGNGIIRLYREFEGDSPSDSSHSSAMPIPSDQGETVIPGDDSMVAIIAVPTYFTATDLLGFIGENYLKYVSHIRILKSEKPNRFLVLLKFRDIVKAAEFQYGFNGKPFNSMEPETCHVIYVSSVKVDYVGSEVSEAADSIIPFLLQDPFTSPPASIPNSPSNRSEGFSMVSSELPLIELPTCPVCLERMDANVTGLLTIPCQHTFHCQCLSKWKDDTCPICRYSNNFSNQRVRQSVRRLSQIRLPRISHGHSITSVLPSPSEEQEDVERCVDCSADENLWICLICGNVGCSRYAPEQHSLKHFINTGHCFAMELNTSRVWDYAGDNYVHRLVTNESDGKLVELPEKNEYSSSGKSDSTSVDKVDEVGFEYSQLLISQLASQRDYYESLLQEKEAPKSRRGSSLSSAKSSAMLELEAKLESLTTKLNDVTENIIPSMRDKIAHKDEKLSSLAKELDTTNALNDALSKKVEFLNKTNDELKEKISSLEQEKTGLSEQVTDLMFFLDSQEKFKNESQDVKDGTVVIQQNPTSSSSKKSKKKKK
ncbi:BRCA1-associated protein 2-domain-containing protein [Scheffersomyces xylosifermentans]|uniref:BRCA1-associated protein 2-domain-containing protein n=1 Tax=Scheffersomyces xylosifermentans TaxID=1304137 RepID=UPI00315CD0B6